MASQGTTQSETPKPKLSIPNDMTLQQACKLSITLLSRKSITFSSTLRLFLYTLLI